MARPFCYDSTERARLSTDSFETGRTAVTDTECNVASHVEVHADLGILAKYSKIRLDFVVWGLRATGGVQPGREGFQASRVRRLLFQ